MSGTTIFCERIDKMGAVCTFFARSDDGKRLRTYELVDGQEVQRPCPELVEIGAEAQASVDADIRRLLDEIFSDSGEEALEDPPVNPSPSGEHEPPAANP